MLHAPPALEQVVAKTPLQGTQWRLVKLSGRKVDTQLSVSFNIQGNTVGVFDNCNGSGGKVAVSATTLRALDPQVTTGIACLKTLPLPALFRRGATYQISGRTLTLIGDGKVWMFSGTPMPSRPPNLPSSPAQP